MSNVALQVCIVMLIHVVNCWCIEALHCLYPTIGSISTFHKTLRHCVCRAMQVWQMQTPRVMAPLQLAMRHCLHLCCQFLLVRLSCRAYRLALHLPLYLLAGGCSLHRLHIFFGPSSFEIVHSCTSVCLLPNAAGAGLVACACVIGLHLDQQSMVVC